MPDATNYIRQILILYSQFLSPKLPGLAVSEVGFLVDVRDSHMIIFSTQHNLNIQI